MSLFLLVFGDKIIYFLGYTPIKMGVFFGKICFFSKIPPEFWREGLIFVEMWGLSHRSPDAIRSVGFQQIDH